MRVPRLAWFTGSENAARWVPDEPLRSGWDEGTRQESEGFHRMSLSTDLDSAHLPPDVQLEFRRQFRVWRELLANCGRKPGRKVVHNLRVTTLRLQAALELSLRSIDAGSSPAKSAERWSRQAKKLRRVLGPVRRSDVSLTQLARIRGWAEPPDSAPAVFPKEYLSVIEKMERTVTRRRKSAAKKLADEIERRCKRLNRLSRKLETTASGFSSTKEIGVAGKIQSQLAAIGAEFAVLDTENLHEFRKRIKKTRYLAEMFASTDSSAAGWASMLKRMTSAIGEWHDWHVLAEEATRAGRSEAATTATAEFLRTQAWRRFEDARTLCTDTMARLLESAADPRRNPASAQMPPRKPVASVSPVPDGMDAERSVRSSKLAG